MPDNHSQKIPADVLHEAAVWNARIHFGAPTEADRTDYAAWLAVHPMHRYAMARVRNAAAKAGQAGADFRQQLDPTPRESHLSRRAAFAGGALAACAALTVGYYALSSSSYETAKGELELVALADGSQVHLNTDSQIRVRFSPDARRIRLERGEALFSVAHDPLRPFIVEAGPQQVHAIGTKFAVRVDPESFCVLVTEGEVAVAAGRARHRGEDRSRRLIANQSLSRRGDSDLALRVYEPSAVERRLAWRNRMLEFDGEFLPEALREVERYHDVRFVIDDPSLQSMRLWLYFRADNLDGFLDFLDETTAEPGPLDIERRGREIHIRRAAASTPL